VSSCPRSRSEPAGRPYDGAVGEALLFGAVASSGLVLGTVVGVGLRLPERVLALLEITSLTKVFSLFESNGAVLRGREMRR
jgi:hypothetical protein